MLVLCNNHWLPDKRDKTILHLFHIGYITAQFVLQHVLLEHGSSCKNEHKNQSNKDAITGAKQEGCPDHEEQDGAIHGVSDEMIGACGDDSVSTFFLNAHHGGQVGVFSKRQKQHVE